MRFHWGAATDSALTSSHTPADAGRSAARAEETTMPPGFEDLGPSAGPRTASVSRLMLAAIALIGCAMVSSALSVLPGAAASAATTDARDSRALVVALASSLSDVGTAASLVAAGEGDAVLFAESAGSLGEEASRAAARWQPQRALIVGGVRAVSSSVEEELRRLSLGVRIERLAGTDRVHTAALAADRVLAGVAPEVLIIANGWSLPDVGVAASAVASGAAEAVLYVGRDSLGEPTRRVLERHSPLVVIAVGGAAALTPQVQRQAERAAGGARSIRLGGATRVETAALVSRDAIRGGASEVVVANGWSLSDVGAAAALAAALPHSTALYAAGADALGDAAERAIGGRRPDRIILVGDENSLSSALHADLRTAADEVARVVSPAQATNAALGFKQPELFAQIAAGQRYTCAVRVDGGVSCRNGHGSANRVLVEVPRDQFDQVVSSRWTRGSDGYSCGIKRDKSLVCWGAGLRERIDKSPSGSFAAAAAGSRHLCAIRTDKTISCWGDNNFGQADAPSGKHEAIAAGYDHSCAIHEDRTVVCWGGDRLGQSSAPQGHFVEVGAGTFFSCGIRSDGTVVCWGSGSRGQLAAPSGRHSGLSVGDDHSCALGINRTASCWGDNSDGRADPPAGPLAAVSAGTSHTCGLRSDFTLECNRDGWSESPDNPTVDEPPAIQAVYAVPDGEIPVDSRRDAIADAVSVAQAWFRSQTEGRHPVFVRRGVQIDVKAIGVRLPPLAEQQAWGRSIASEIRETLGMSPDAPLLIFVEGRVSADSDTRYPCGWRSRRFVMIPIANCDIEPKVGAQWPHGSSYILAHELTHLLGAVPDCAPNHVSGHVDDDRRDIIYSGPDDRDWANLTLDVGRDDYYMHGRDDCHDISDHPLLRIE